MFYPVVSEASYSNSPTARSGQKPGSVRTGPFLRRARDREYGPKRRSHRLGLKAANSDGACGGVLDIEGEIAVCYMDLRGGQCDRVSWASLSAGINRGLSPPEGAARLRGHVVRTVQASKNS